MPDRHEKAFTFLIAVALVLPRASGKAGLMPSEAMQPHVSDLSALVARTDYTQPVVRDGFSTPGDGGRAIYVHSVSACSATGGDSGSEVVDAAGTGCWKIDWSSVGDEATPQLFGAKADGLTDDSAELLKAYSANRRVRLVGTYAIAMSLTIPSGSLTDFTNGRLAVGFGATVRIAGHIRAPFRQIFMGKGSVVGLRFNRPEWWGAVGNYGNTIDSAPAFNSAVASAEASFNVNSPASYSDGGRPTVDFGGGGFYQIGSPINIHPGPSRQLDFIGSGILNGGSRLDAMSKFTGDNVIDVHGVANGNNGAWDLTLRDFQVTDYNRAVSGACIRFVPEGAGYALNSGNQRASLIENVLTGCAIGFDVANTLDLTWRRTDYQGVGNTNNIGYRLMTVGGGPTADTGEMTFDGIQTHPCPSNNASTCTNTIGMQLLADGTNVADGSNPGVAALVFQGNTIFWGSNQGLTALASNGGIIADTWINNVQFDGPGCSFMSFRSTGTGNLPGGSVIPSSISDIHAYHNYQTAMNSASCFGHVWQSDTGGTMARIWDQDNWMIGTIGVGTRVFGVNMAQVSGNILEGGNSGTSAIIVDGQSTKVQVKNNVCSGGIITTPWQSCVSITSPTNYISHGGNLSFNSGPSEANNSNGTNNDPPNPVTVATLPACTSGSLGSRILVTDATAYTANAAPTGGGNVTVPVVCTSSGSTPTYAWTMH